MKVVILAGGLGTRLRRRRRSAEADGGDRRASDPVAHHEGLRRQGFNDFVVCLGYKGYVIKEYFANYFLHNSDVTFDLRGRAMDVHENAAEPWR